MSDLFEIGGDRMDELAARFAPNFEAAHSGMFDAIVADPDVSPIELGGLMLRSAIAAAAAAIALVSRDTGIPMGELIRLASAGIDFQLGAAVRQTKEIRHG